MSAPVEIPVGFVWQAENLGAGFSDMEGQIYDVTLKIAYGERVAILGHEKSGRAYLLRVLAGLRPMRSGRLNILDEELQALPYWADWDEILSHEKRRKMGVCLEREGLLSNVTAREGLEMLFRFKYGDHNVKLREGSQRVVNQLAQRFGISEILDKRPYSLTSAERRLVGLARSFLSKPSILCLENPSESIGNLNRRRFLAVFEEICSQPERTLLLSTDDWPLALHFCPRWIVMEHGRVAFDGQSRDFLQTEHEFARQIRDLMGRARSVEEILGKQP
ncbi:MAG: ATP-binding cassette domain-containing protein [Bdellovibrionales bacterium]|nr:ATP-binding cassette domain-containing protein [Bdellovibrionales bacterium]